ncbi:hypothetical protein [Amaricoccus solimangrovi]|uniref:Fido domain-containing protein n=1 Tax=Amaricoccus solimangrovi TaxID=2589815 RepID=A0A501WRD7_9RHOB|nr:hypothetical protein [Amaricoccus solimangrovi]TPE52029.1 hypothetical protein FJM51_06255 [Amaricoccus solimangrovi]
MEWRRLNIARIEATLDGLLARSVAPETWERLREEPLTRDATRRLGLAYRAVDRLLGARIDIFEYGESRRILELNHLVLCGDTPERRAQYADHLAATEHRFYDDPRGGVAALMDRYARSRRHAPEVLAAEIYVQTVSGPQLFLEGNSRAAAVLASYCLARAGLPPLVVTAETMPEYHGLVERSVAVDRDGITGMLSFGTAVRRLAHFIRETGDADFLLPSEMRIVAGGEA